MSKKQRKKISSGGNRVDQQNATSSESSKDPEYSERSFTPPEQSEDNSEDKLSDKPIKRSRETQSEDLGNVGQSKKTGWKRSLLEDNSMPNEHLNQAEKDEKMDQDNDDDNDKGDDTLEKSDPKGGRQHAGREGGAEQTLGDEEISSANLARPSSFGPCKYLTLDDLVAALNPATLFEDAILLGEDDHSSNWAPEGNQEEPEYYMKGFMDYVDQVFKEFDEACWLKDNINAAYVIIDKDWFEKNSDPPFLYSAQPTKFVPESLFTPSSSSSSSSSSSLSAPSLSSPSSSSSSSSSSA
jgi:hypothetical protein